MSKWLDDWADSERCFSLTYHECEIGVVNTWSEGCKIGVILDQYYAVVGWPDGTRERSCSHFRSIDDAVYAAKSYVDSKAYADNRTNRTEERPVKIETPVRLNLGAGYTILEGWVNIDRTPCSPDVMQGEVYPLEGWADETVDMVRASHVLEHFSHTKTWDVLVEWVRVLKPGGVLQIAVPDFVWIAKHYAENPDDQSVPIQSYVMGGHTDENDHHGAIFDEAGLTQCLKQLGLIDVQRWESPLGDCASLPVSLNLMARKPGDGETAELPALYEPTVVYEDVPEGVSVEDYLRHPMPKYITVDIPRGEVHAIQTVPRLGFTQTGYDAHQAFTHFDIPFYSSGGVFWQKALENMLQERIDAGAKYILTLDYDTCFGWQDVQALYGLMEDNPDVGAICSMQMRRDLGTLLIGMRDPSTDEPLAQVPLEDMRADLLPIATGHFGLTIIRASALADMPKPWMQMVPNSQGEWKTVKREDGTLDGPIDADVNFWLKFRAAGQKLCQANRVVIGHAELVVTWPGRDLRPVVQPSAQYLELGKPSREYGIWH